MKEQLPEQFRSMDRDEQFCFDCHPGVSCFTECCRELDLALTPYDVLRLRKRLQILSGAFLEQYVIIEWDERLLFPQCYLTMIDDGRASCVFVSSRGCTVYEDRPGSCRAYPIGRGASRNGKNDQLTEHYVVVREPHCTGFRENSVHTPGEYLRGQGMDGYTRFNDALTALLQHEQIRLGFRPDRTQLDQYILALYNLDQFRLELTEGRISMQNPLQPWEMQGLTGDDEQLLLLGIKWLQQEFFGQ